MKLRNKKTGEIKECAVIPIIDGYVNEYEVFEKGNSLAELNEEWEDYEEQKEWYWFIEDNGIIQRSCHYEDLHPTLDKARKEIGNYFNTREEAEQAVEKLKAWKRLKDEGFRFDGWDENHHNLGIIEFSFPNVEKSVYDFEKDLELLFGGEE